MTKHRFSTGHATARPLAAALVLLLALPLTAVQAQISLPSGAPRLAAPAASAPAGNAAPRAGTASQRQADFIVVVVNSEPITNSEVRTKLLRTEQQFQQQGTPVPPRSELLPQLLERMISDKAQLQAAQTSGVKVDDNAVDAAVQTVARQNQLPVEELRRRLKSDGIDYAQFRSEIRDELLISRLRQREVESRVTVSEQDIDAYLRDQEGKTGSASASAAALNLAEILLAVPENAKPDQVAALQAKAQQVLERARSGAPMKLARAGVKDMVRISDGRMSGTAAGTIVLHVTPEAAIGGPLAHVQSGDRIRLSVAGREISLLISDQELAARATANPVTRPHAERGYHQLFLKTVTQADQGVDFDFLRAAEITQTVPRSA